MQRFIYVRHGTAPHRIASLTNWPDSNAQAIDPDRSHARNAGASVRGSQRY